MKKLFLLSCIIICSFQGTFAYENTLTVGETLTQYFEELFTEDHTAYTGITLKYIDIKRGTDLENSLQK